MIGPSADDEDALLGNYNGFSKKQVAPLEGIRQQFCAARPRYASRMGATYTAQSAAPIPAEAFTPPDGNGHGLLAEYFANANLEGCAGVPARGGSARTCTPEMRPRRRVRRDGVFGALDGVAAGAGNGRLPAGAAWRRTGQHCGSSWTIRNWRREARRGAGGQVLLPAHSGGRTRVPAATGVPVAGRRPRERAARLDSAGGRAAGRGRGRR